jgi:hypothetical protein
LLKVGEAGAQGECIAKVFHYALLQTLYSRQVTRWLLLSQKKAPWKWGFCLKTNNPKYISDTGNSTMKYKGIPHPFTTILSKRAGNKLVTTFTKKAP